MNNILICGFNGKNNTSKILLDTICDFDKIYMINSFETSVKQVISRLENNSYNYILMFGQVPNTKDIHIETIGRKDDVVFETNYDYTTIYHYLLDLGYNIKISNNAGNYLCNNVYYNTLKYINKNNRREKVLFIHIPDKTNIFDMNKFSSDLISFFKGDNV